MSNDLDVTSELSALRPNTIVRWTRVISFEGKASDIISLRNKSWLNHQGHTRTGINSMSARCESEEVTYP